ncbi:MAG: hypothetical protein U0350_32495 [Caldilineaceae bacterium]
MANPPSADELLTKIFDRQRHVLALRFAQWLASSKRFRAFTETYQTKIRAKVRNSQDQARLGDIAFELETAYWLLQEPRLTVAYEQPGGGSARRPDFAVTFTTKFTFSVEVTRMRSTPSEESERDSNKLHYVVANKLAQMLPGMINLLVVGAADEFVCNIEIDTVMAQMKKRVEAKDAQLFSRGGFSDASEFFRHYHRLSGIWLCSTPAQANTRQTRLWVNKEAKHPLLPPLPTILKTPNG